MPRMRAFSTMSPTAAWLMVAFALSLGIGSAVAVDRAWLRVRKIGPTLFRDP